MIQVTGPLFEKVQKSHIFLDSKTFVDAVPTIDPELILSKYHQEKLKKSFDLKEFILAHFILPSEIQQSKNFEKEFRKALSNSWDFLRKKLQAKNQNDTLISLPYPHIVPGGRFRECYYWDSYFTALGLLESKQLTLLDGMIENFCHLIKTYGFIPNGNRTYYLSRSQAPFFSHLISLKKDYQKYLPYLEKEYEYFMNKPSKVCIEENGATTILNRYYDEKNSPRPESFAEDLAIGKNSSNPEIYRDIRSACESGWDFSSRWFEKSNDLSSIQTTSILPIDLNCLLYHMEMVLEKKELAEKRKEAINNYFYDEDIGFYFDYQFKKGKKTSIYSLASLFPLFVKIATKEQAQNVKKHIESNFLFPGGLTTTLTDSKQQWDYPNGWAPLHWIAIIGLKNYGYHKLAKEIAKRFTLSAKNVFARTNTFVEKYHVLHSGEKPQDGEYRLQIGFGWTNGVLQATKWILE